MPKFTATYFAPNVLAVTVGKRAKFPEKVKNIAQTQMKNMTSPTLEVKIKVIMKRTIEVHRQSMVRCDKKKENGSTRIC